MNETELETLIVRLTGNSSEYLAMLKKAESATKEADGHIQFATKRISALGMSLKGYGTQAVAMLLPLLGVLGAVATATKAIQLAAKEEENIIDFGVMLGDPKKGEALVGMLQGLADRSPLASSGLQQAAKMLLGAKVAGDDIVPTLERIGNAVGASKEKLQSMALVYSQVMSQNRMTGEDKNQFINAGFNPLTEMERTTGKSMPQLEEMMHKGQITAEMVKQALKTASAPGGQFEGRIQQLSNSVTGLFSTLQDTVDGTLRAIGKDLIEGFNIKEIIRQLTALSERMRVNWNIFVYYARRAWNEVKDHIIAFWEIVKPYWEAALEKFRAAWKYTKMQVKEFWDWLTGVIERNKEELKAVGMAILLIAAVWLGVKLAIIAANVAMTIFNILVTGATGGLNLVVMAIVAIVAAVAAWIMSIGGVTEAWQVVKQAAIDAWDWTIQKAEEFMEWFRPIWKSIEGAVVAGWNAVKRAAVVVWEETVSIVMSAWERIQSIASKVGKFFEKIWGDVGGGSIDWSKMQERIQTFFIFWEWAFMNAGKIWEHFKLKMILGIIVLAAELEFTFTTRIPAVLNFFADNWRTIMVDIYNLTTTIFRNLGNNVSKLIKAIPDLIRGKTTFAQLWDELDTDLLKGFEKKTKEFKLPDRIPSQVEDYIRKEYEAQLGALGESFEAFRKRKLEEYKSTNPTNALVPDGEDDWGDDWEIIDQATKLGGETGKAMAKAAGEEVQKIDAVARSSADALGRIKDFQEKMFYQANPDNATGTGVKVEATGAKTLEAEKRKEDSKTLRDILGELKIGNKKEAVQLPTAEVA